MSKDCPCRFYKKVRIICTVLDLAVMGIIIALNARISPASSEEYIYTINKVAKFGLPICLLLLFLANILPLACHTSGKKRIILLILLSFAPALIAIPVFLPDAGQMPWLAGYVYSACWAFGFILIAIVSLMLGSVSTSSLATWIFCILDSILLAFAFGEFGLLFSQQTADGLTNASAASKYVLSGNALPEGYNYQIGICGRRAAAQTANAAHKMQKFDEVLFDVHYGYNASGLRQLPKMSIDSRNNLAIFGCSYAFGHGLEDEQTWAWQLANMLGYDWKIENYASNGYSPAQMLCLLENNLIVAPTTEYKFAIFLAIEHQLRRNEFFPLHPHYELDENGEAIRNGTQAYVWITNLPNLFNGFQLVREFSRIVSESVVKKENEKMLALYLAMLKQSSRLLREKYATTLTVLLWPDLEYIAPDLEKANIPVLYIKNFLPRWENNNGSNYAIHPIYEIHPNSEASKEIAQGLAAYFSNLVSKNPSKN